MVEARLLDPRVCVRVYQVADAEVPWFIVTERLEELDEEIRRAERAGEMLPYRTDWRRRSLRCRAEPGTVRPTAVRRGA